MKKSYEQIVEEELRKNGTVRGYMVKSGKREETKSKTVKAIVDNLPSTLQVLAKRTGYSKTTLKLYLDKLISVRAVRRELDMYFLDNDVKSRNPLTPTLRLVMYRWYDLPEYATPKVLEPNKKGSAVELALRGKKPIPTRETVRRKIREYEKKHGK